VTSVFPMPRISFEDVVVRYAGARVSALDGVSFDVPRGAMTAVAGPNGSGKSTLVRALLRRQRLLRGKITIDGDDIAAITQRELARRVAIAPQREEAAFPMRVEEYVSLGRFPRLGLWESPSVGDREAVERALHRAGVSEFIDRRTDELSGGEWQRVRIARALAQEGGALVLDEPTTFLDMPHEMALFELLDSLARDGLAVLIVSHQLNLLARFARTIVLLDRGRVAAAGTPVEVMRAPVLESIYDWPLVVTRDPAAGAPALLPLRRPTSLS
jgi:iron complex transport system ATP-binding protein